MKLNKNQSRDLISVVALIGSFGIITFLLITERHNETLIALIVGMNTTHIGTILRWYFTPASSNNNQTTSADAGDKTTTS